MYPVAFTDLTRSPAAGPCHGPSCTVRDAPLRVDPLAFALRGVTEYRHLCDEHDRELCDEA